MKRFHLKGLDCANCALEIEQVLKRTEGVRAVSLNFSTATLQVDAEDLDAVREQVRRTAPEVQLVDTSEAGEGYEHDPDLDDEDAASLKWELGWIGLAAVLFLGSWIARGPLAMVPYGLGERGVLLAAYLISGWPVLRSAFRDLLRLKAFDENFLMTLATLGALLIGEIHEAVGVMLFFRVGEFLQDLSVQRSRRSIRALLAVRPDYANLKRDGEIVRVSPAEVKVGDLFLVKPGERIPLDGEVVEGASTVDTSALTGEPQPRPVDEGDSVLAGMINQGGALTVRATRPFEASSIARILELVEQAGARKAKTERFITRFARYYTPAVVLLALGVATFPPLFAGASWSAWLYRALVLLVISCPCALVLSIPLSYFGGIGGASRKGILIKGASFLDVLHSVKTVVFDKTGTLTQGKFHVSQAIPQDGWASGELLHLAASVESQSNHPIARSIQEASQQPVDPDAVKEYTEIAGHGVRARVGAQTVLAGNDGLLHREKIPHAQEVCDLDGTLVHLAVDGAYAGHIRVEDTVKDDAPRAVAALRDLGVERILMFTGDRQQEAEKLARKLGLDGYHAEMLPEDKVRELERYMREKPQSDHKVAFVGDGINDAPVIARADVGIAMGGMGSEAAIETADVVIMTDDPSKVAQAIAIGRKTRRIVWQNIVLAVGVKLAVIVLGVFGAATMWEAVFADVGVSLIAVLNATRVLR